MSYLTKSASATTIPYAPSMPALVNRYSDLNGKCIPPIVAPTGIRTFSKQFVLYNHPEAAVNQYWTQAVCLEDNKDGRVCPTDVDLSNYKINPDGTNSGKLVCQSEADNFTILNLPTNAPAPAKPDCPQYTVPLYGYYDRRTWTSPTTMTNVATPTNWYCTPYANVPQAVNILNRVHLSNADSSSYSGSKGRSDSPWGGYWNDNVDQSVPYLNSNVVRTAPPGFNPCPINSNLSLTEATQTVTGGTSTRYTCEYSGINNFPVETDTITCPSNQILVNMYINQGNLYGICDS